MFDVVVIGAGLSGLQAAYTAQQRGLRVVVVEARDRVGGKTWSVPLASGRGCADLGAAWINDVTQPRVGKYCRQFGIPLVKQRIEGKAVMQVAANDRIVFPFGVTPEFNAEDKKSLEFIRDHIQNESLKKEAPRPEDDALSLAQYVRKLGASPKATQMVNLWVKVMHGLEATQESAAFYIDYCRRNGGLFSIRADDHTGGNHQRLSGGTQQVSEGIAKLVGQSNVHLSAPVASIQDRETHMTVTTTNGQEFVGRKCIVTIPTAMLQDVNISPPLPPRLRQMHDSSRLGHYNKVIVCYDKPWWRDLGFNGFFLSYDGPVAMARDTCVEEANHYSITCFVNGQVGAEWAKLYPHERRSLVLKQIGAVFNVDSNSEAFRPIEVFDQIWKHEKYSQGALAPISEIGNYTKFADVYGKPVGNLHFAGTEFATHWKGYMEGALCSGEHEATVVADVINKVPRAQL